MLNLQPASSVCLSVCLINKKFYLEILRCLGESTTTWLSDLYWFSKTYRIMVKHVKVDPVKILQKNSHLHWHTYFYSKNMLVLAFPFNLDLGYPSKTHIQFFKNIGGVMLATWVRHPTSYPSLSKNSLPSIHRQKCLCQWDPAQHIKGLRDHSCNEE